MTEEQFKALDELMSAHAYVAVGNAIHQPRTKEILQSARNNARYEFNLDPIYDEDDQ
jgi:hypothetical protein